MGQKAAKYVRGKDELFGREVGVSLPFLCETSTESVESRDVEGDSAGGETEKSLGGSSQSSSLEATLRGSPVSDSVTATKPSQITEKH